MATPAWVTKCAAGLGVKMAAPDREIYVMVGDGSWLMMSSELVTAIQEGIKLTVVLLDNHGFQSIGGLSRAIGNGAFGTRTGCATRKRAGSTAGIVQLDFAANARSLGAHVIAAQRHPGTESGAGRGAAADPHDSDRDGNRSEEARPGL